jgi:hypothetical protein
VVKGGLKKGKSSTKYKVNEANMIEGRRDRSAKKVQFVERKPATEKKLKKNKSYQFNVGDTISADPKLFDGEEPGSFSDDNPELQIGKIVKVWQGKEIVQVKWLDRTKSYQKFADIKVEKMRDVAAYMVAVMVAAVLRKEADPNDKESWPKDFFQAMIKPDWREWIAAVKKEISSWLDFNAYSKIPFEQRTPGASIVPLGELFTRKRDGSYKFRQYLMGNLLRQGKDYDETFSACISWDGIRWSAAIACTTGKEIRGLDAVTGFLQAKSSLISMPSYHHMATILTCPMRTLLCFALSCLT